GRGDHPPAAGLPQPGRPGAELPSARADCPRRPGAARRGPRGAGGLRPAQPRPGALVGRGRMSMLDQRASLGTTAGLAPAEQMAVPQVTNYEGDTRIRAVTFNVCHGLGLDGHQDLERTAQVLRELAPDIAGLQEVEEGAERSGGIDQAAWLADALGMRFASG